MTNEEKFNTEEMQNTTNCTEEQDDGVVTLISGNGEPIDFIEIAGIAYKGEFYSILQPVELLDGMGNDEALVFKVMRGEDGQDKFVIELDDAIIDAVFDEYNILYNQAQAELNDK